MSKIHPLNISLDFDSTYSADPEMWNMFCITAMARGHKVYCVTARCEADLPEVKSTVGKIIGEERCIATNLKAKKHHVKTKHKLNIHIWIDDMPEFIGDSYPEGFVY